MISFQGTKKSIILIIFFVITSKIIFTQDKDKYVILDSAHTRKILKYWNKEHYWKPKKEDVIIFEKELKDYLMKTNNKELKVILEEFSNYKLQYFGYIEKNKKYLYINGFCADIDYWKEELVRVNDGGYCFFQVIYDKKGKKIIHFSVNGH